MTIEELKALFEKHEDEHCKFDRIENPPYRKPDLCAFVLLETLCPSDELNIIDAAEHDEIYLSVYPEDFAKVATEADVLYLIRCGVWHNHHQNSFCMFV